MGDERQSAIRSQQSENDDAVKKKQGILNGRPAFVPNGLLSCHDQFDSAEQFFAILPEFQGHLVDTRQELVSVHHHSIFALCLWFTHQCL